jgi:multidrug resistance efflux pump
MNNKVLWVVGLTGFVLPCVVAAIIFLPRAGEASGGETSGTDDEIVKEVVPEVKTITPMQNLSTKLEVQEPADVEAFFRSDLAAQVAGMVKYMPKAIGARVTKGEILAEIDAPDRVQEVAEKVSVIEQRRMELEGAKAKARIQEAAVKVAEERIKHRQAQVVVADHERDLAKDIWDRYIGLTRDGVVTENVVVEKRKAYMVADAGTVSARVAVQQAKAELTEEEEKLAAAHADIKLKETLVRVARKDRDRAQALLDYTRITAPFDGEIIHRYVDPGDFVQNSATGQAKPILSVVRTDIMTVVMKIPDTYASYVTQNTEAIIRLPGRLIRAKVTRKSNSIHEKDRTMRIEVDLYNGSRAEYEQFLRDRWGATLAGLASPRGLEGLNLLAAGRSVWVDMFKDADDPLPVFPEDAAGRIPRRRPRLLPRMYGTMKLLLNNFQDAFLIPSRAIFSRGGKRYIVLVENGKAIRKPVRVQVDDGRLAKVTILLRKSTDAGDVDIPVELAGTESVVIDHQSELSDGQAVKPKTIEKWPEELKLLKHDF